MQVTGEYAKYVKITFNPEIVRICLSSIKEMPTRSYYKVDTYSKFIHVMYLYSRGSDISYILDYQYLSYKVNRL